ncbi:MAG TPA: haloacid dehalogenase type II [Methylomirabilota bacterium]|nr:haloacid dehalogenase type II [Methylomirabilota bacterium]
MTPVVRPPISTRREFLNLVVAAAGITASARPARAANTTAIEALAFDALTIFDLRPVFTLAERLFPGRGTDLSAAWRTRQFEYTWLRALSGRYADFWTVTEEALVFAANMLRLELDPDRRAQLMNAHRGLKAYPDALPALRLLKDSGIRLGILTNMSPKMLDAAIDSAGLGGIFEQRLSTDAIRTYKPDPRAYHMAIDAFGLRLAQIGFVAFGGWDAAGARSFGYTTFWVNRLALPMEELGTSPDGIGASLTDLAAFMRLSPRRADTSR